MEYQGYQQRHASTGHAAQPAAAELAAPDPDLQRQVVALSASRRWSVSADGTRADYAGRGDPPAAEVQVFEAAGIAVRREELVYDPRAGQPPRPGNGRPGRLARGDGVRATHQTASGPVEVGDALMGGPDEREVIDYGPVQVAHSGVEPQDPAPFGHAVGPAHPPSGVDPLSTDATAAFFTPETIAQFSGVRDTYPNQHAVMSGHSASELYAHAGRQPPEEPAHHLHRHRFVHGGQDGENPQQQHNLIPGPAGANYRHLVAEEAASQVAHDRGIAITSTVPHGVDEEAHMADAFDYQLHPEVLPEAPIAFPIDLHDARRPRHGDQEHVQAAVDAHMNYATTWDAFRSSVQAVSFEALVAFVGREEDARRIWDWAEHNLEDPAADPYADLAMDSDMDDASATQSGGP